MNFSAVILTVVVWLANGDPQAPIVRVMPNMTECLDAADRFTAAAQADNAANSYPMRASWHTDCRVVLNHSEAKPL